MRKNNLLYKSRDFHEVPIWKNVTSTQWNDPVWQRKNTIRTVEQLKNIIKLSPHQVLEIKRTIKAMKKQGKEPMRITPYYASLIHHDPFHPEMLPGEKSNKRIDPIFWQSVPTPANLLFPNTGHEGAMCEENRSYGSAYQRYPNRVALFVAENTSCASYCNHCQRAKSLDSTSEVSLNEINKGIFYINYNKNIDEVLVTGGDALMINIQRLEYILKELSKIEHIRVIRIATRVPVVMPMGITDELLDMINRSANRYNTGLEKYVYFMTQINHYQEITEELATAVKKIRAHGFTIRNQTVLLNHVNDYFLTLAETFRRMLWIGVHPYYLLQCHKERGIVHFIVPIQIGKIYMKHFQGWLSGVVRPNYVANIEGGGGKILLMPTGHDTLHEGSKLEDKISESYADVLTWDHKEISHYEALGRATIDEYSDAVSIMDRFIGRKGVFLPKIIIIDEKENPVETTNRTKLPRFEKFKKAELLNYSIYENDMPLINPLLIKDELDLLFNSQSK